MPGSARRRFLRVEIVEVVQIVGPELVCIARLPVCGGRAVPLDVQEAERLRTQHRNRTGTRRHVRAGRGAWRRRRSQIGAWPMQAEPRSGGDLRRTKMPQRMEIERQSAQCRAASPSAIATRATSSNSSKAIGATPPRQPHRRTPRRRRADPCPGATDCTCGSRASRMPRKRAEVVELQDPPAGEHLDAFLRERAVRRWQGSESCPMEPSANAQRDHRSCHRVAPGCRHSVVDCRVDDRLSRQKAQQVDEVARLADDAPAADRGILGPVRAAESRRH